MAEKVQKQLKGVTQKDLVGVIPLEDPDNVIVVRASAADRYGGDRLDVRLFWHPEKEKEGLYVPTKRGVHVPVGDIETFVELCTEAQDRLEDAEEERP